MSTNYYDENAAKFCKSTFHLDISKIRNRFLAYLPETGKILDAGCGSGRDSLRFKKAGYNVVAFDASIEMVSRASENIGQDVHHMRFEDITFLEEFDGIWACASLLHVPKKMLSSIFHKFALALKKDGTLYVSFKYGDSERKSDDGREFTDLNETGLTQLLLKEPLLSLCETWITHDCRPGRASEKWLNATLTRTK